MLEVHVHVKVLHYTCDIMPKIFMLHHWNIVMIAFTIMLKPRGCGYQKKLKIKYKI